MDRIGRIFSIDEDSGHTLKVERPYYEQDQLNAELNYFKPKHSVSQYVSSKLKEIDPTKFLMSVFPIISWIPQYNLRTDLMGDIISGCTVAVMHIPQGMGYALLANVPPIVGIYMAYFPVFMYFIFGTSRHNSMGTFAVVSIMIGKAVSTYSTNTGISDDIGILTKSPIELIRNNSHISTVLLNSDRSIYTPMQVATTVCFFVGLIQVLMYVFRLGIFSTLLSDTLVSGFTTGAGIHVLTTQIVEVLGISLPSINGPLKVVYTYIELFTRITTLNWMACVLSTVTIIILVINNDWLKSKISKKCSIPIPIELILVVTGTLVSNYLELNKNWKIKTVGDIPVGLPQFELPKFELFNQLAVDCFIITIVSYTVSVSMALIFAQKLNYDIDFNQELLAMGAGNIFGSFFSCFPFSASLSRSTIQQSVGGKTQIASLISCGLLTFVLLWIGPFFEPLPRCVLAGIIIVALKGMLLQVKHFFVFWKLSHLDAIIWMVTFLSVVIVSIDIGLLVGVILSLAYILIRGMKPYTCLLGHVPKTDLYVDINRYKAAEEINSIKIFHYCGSLNFASRASFKNVLCEVLGIDLGKEISRINKATNSGESDKKIHNPINFKFLILDFSALSYVDSSAVTSLKSIIQDFNKLSIAVYIAAISCPSHEMMKKCGLKDDKDDKSFKFFPTVHDAVHHALDSKSQVNSIADVDV